MCSGTSARGPGPSLSRPRASVRDYPSFPSRRTRSSSILLERNRSAFAASSMTIVPGSAPEVLASLPVPDRVFVGGSGGSLAGIIDVARTNMKRGIMIVNAATLETLDQAVSGLEGAGFRVRVAEISVARSRPVAGKRLMTALNPVFIITGEKE